MDGIIKKKIQEKGFGFIAPANGGEDLFFHFSGCVDKIAGYDALQEGMKVSFETQPGKDGRPMAVSVRVLEEAANDALYGAEAMAA